MVLIRMSYKKRIAKYGENSQCMLLQGHARTYVVSPNCKDINNGSGGMEKKFKKKKHTIKAIKLE